MDWRLDYSIRSKHGGRKNAAMYFVVLKVKDRGLPREIQMMASYEDLQDMLAKVIDAYYRRFLAMTKSSVFGFRSRTL